MSLRFRQTRIAAIARREFRATVRRREFLLLTLGLPLLYAVMAALVFGATVSAMDSAHLKQSHQSLPVIGFLDATGKLDQDSFQTQYNGFSGRLFRSESAGTDAVRKGEARAFVLVHQDFAKNGEVTLFLPPIPFSLSADTDEDYRPPVTHLLRRAALASRVSPDILNLALLPIVTKDRVLDAKSGRFAAPDALRDLARFVVPYTCSALLLISVLLSSSYLLHGVVEEKENRIIEVLISSVTHEEILIGKLIGLGSAGLAQLLFWLLGAALITDLVKPSAMALAPGAGVLVTSLLMFGLGYALYAAIMAGIGSLGTSWRESQHIASVGAVVLMVPLLFLPVLLEDPNGSTARILSMFPLTAPNAMLIRVAAGGASVFEVVLSSTLLILSAWGVLILTARLFRYSLLMQGQRPDPKLLARELFSNR